MSLQRDYLQDGSGDEVLKMNPDKVSLSLMYGGCMYSDPIPDVWWMYCDPIPDAKNILSPTSS